MDSKIILRNKYIYVHQLKDMIISIERFIYMIGEHTLRVIKEKNISLINTQLVHDLCLKTEAYNKMVWKF